MVLMCTSKSDDGTLCISWLERLLQFIFYHDYGYVCVTNAYAVHQVACNNNVLYKFRPQGKCLYKISLTVKFLVACSAAILYHTDVLVLAYTTKSHYIYFYYIDYDIFLLHVHVYSCIDKINLILCSVRCCYELYCLQSGGCRPAWLRSVQ